MVENPGQEGPDHSPPNLPQGWIAQWDGNARKYYYVVISTGESTWEIPTEPVGGIATPNPTPLPSNSQFQRPQGSHTPTTIAGDDSPARSADGSSRTATDAQGDEYASDRGLGSTALSMLSGKQNNQSHQQSSGLGGLAQSLLGGGSHGNMGSSQGGSGGSVGQLVGGLLSGGNKTHAQQNAQGMSSQSGYGGSGGNPQHSGVGSSQGVIGGGVGQLVGSLLGSGNKTHGQQNSQGLGQSGYGGGNGIQQHSGIGSMLSGILGGSHGDQQQNHGYNNTSNVPSSSGYTGTATSSQYQPASVNQGATHQNQYGPPSGSYNPQSYSGQNQTQKPSQYPNAPQHVQYGGPPPSSNPTAPFYVGGHPDDHTYGAPQQGQPLGYGGGNNGFGQHQHDQYGQQAQGGSGAYNSYQPPPNQYGGQQGGPQDYGQQHQGGAYNQYAPPPPMGSHPSQGGYVGQPQQGGGGYGRPPGPPAWR